MRTSLVLSTLSLLIVSACSQSGSGGAPVDLVPSSLTANGCLDLAGAMGQVQAMSPDIPVRVVTSDVDVRGDNLRRFFVGTVSFSNFKFQERELRATELPTVTQSGCQSVTLTTGPEGAQQYKITPGDDPMVLALDRADGQHMEWKVTGARGLEVKIDAPAMDFCPSYDKATVRSTITYGWGTRDELAAVPIQVSRELLRSISAVDSSMPDPLLALATFDGDDLVTVQASDLDALAHTRLDPASQACPYRAEPPEGAPAPTPTPVPTPTPAPTPTPTPPPPPAGAPAAPPVS